MVFWCNTVFTPSARLADLSSRGVSSGSAINNVFALLQEREEADMHENKKKTKRMS